MGNLIQYLVHRTATAVETLARRQQLVSGIVIRLDGGQVLVNIGGQTIGCQPTVGLPLLSGDQVWVQQGFGQPKIMGVGTRNSEVS